jgi:Zn finger protein HypA/HybF involved in hydrogenase expression
LPIECPHCGRCRTRMDLTSIVRKPGRSEKRTFECPKCNFIETKVVSGPLGSEQVNCLTDNIRSPHE